ncbi:MAG: hypothetical protein GX620_15265 [Chloroflexi bacterium]|nr:hypothetical protein [Chloroflexota bacterium]
MRPKDRMLAALDRCEPDRLPATTHHVMDYFLDTYLNGVSCQEFFDMFGLDPVLWTLPLAPDPERGQSSVDLPAGFLGSVHLMTDEWRVQIDRLPHDRYNTERVSFATPVGTLSMVLQSNQHTTWVTEHLVKRKEDIEIIARYCPSPKCDVSAVMASAETFGDRGLVRGHIPGFDFWGQPGCWQDATCLVGTEELILATFDDAMWVHELLHILQGMKLTFVDSLAGAPYDLLELGGGAASSTVISPRIFDRFVAPYDAPLIERSHAAGQRIVYHTCGGMMPLLERIADMRPDAMETLTPPAMGGDVDLSEVKRRIGDRVCLIGGFDQFHYFLGCTPDATRREVRRCFEAAGSGGGFILAPSDHFFDADVRLIQAFADEAQSCTY